MCGLHSCSMKITEDVRKFAAERNIEEDEALKAGTELKAREFAKRSTRGHESQST
jgi:phosphomethylpyrimidine synthase